MRRNGRVGLSSRASNSHFKAEPRTFPSSCNRSTTKSTAVADSSTTGNYFIIITNVALNPLPTLIPLRQDPDTKDREEVRDQTQTVGRDNRSSSGDDQTQEEGDSRNESRGNDQTQRVGQGRGSGEG
ncbi:hypothetical protein B0O80DRAFT_170768 [Mortierella sp. GBAus27b]|nr:hypothetical protein B0O80DRAFT_170768 [Mortierella sp. GBAus27b]